MANSLLSYLSQIGNKSGIYRDAPQKLAQLGDTLKGVPAAADQPSMSSAPQIFPQSKT